MKDTVTLTVASLLSILLFSLHWADEIARGIETGKLPGIGGVGILLVWLCGTLVLAERRSGYVIILVASLLASGLPIIHLTNKGGAVGGGIAESSGAFFFAWTLIALGVTAIFSVILSARGLWSLQRGEPR